MRLTGSSKDRLGRPLEAQAIVGRRFTCACGGIGLPTIRRRWVEALTTRGHARAMRLLRS